MWSGFTPLHNFIIMKKTYLTMTLLATFIVGFVKVAFAHDPGMSIANVQISNERLNIEISFALSDIETIVGINTNSDDQFSQFEVTMAQAELVQLFSNGVEIHMKNNRLRAENIDLTTKDNENMIVRFTVNSLTTGRLTLYMPILKQLPRGHRQYLIVNKNGSTYQNVLSAESNPVSIDLSTDNSANTFRLYFTQGVQHIFAGIDHVLFLLTLLLPAVLIFSKNQYLGVTKLMPTLIDTVKIVTAFTLAHSITLGLAVFQIIQLPSRLVESMIALSIIICAINNLKPILPVSRWSLAFGFGLIHGFGFANALIDLGIESKKSMLPLLGFNLGIETGQLAIVILVLPIIYIIRHSTIFHIWIFKGGSIASILIACGWMLERTFLL